MASYQEQFDFWNNGEAYGNIYYPTDLAFTPLGDIPPLPNFTPSRDHLTKGREPTVQTFYEGPERCECCINWVEKRPNQIPQGEKDRYDRAAICVYKRKNHQGNHARIGGLIEIKDERVVLQSQFLINIVRPALTRSGFAVPKEGQVEFLAPFKELFFAHSRILRISQMLPSESEEIKHVELLINVMKSLFGDLTASLSQQHSKGMINYASLWCLFPKNMIVYGKRRTQDLLYQVVEAEPEYFSYKVASNQHNSQYKRMERGYLITLRKFAFDGTNFGIIEEDERIEIFEGEKPITRLPVYPIGFHPKKIQVERNATERGRKVLNYQNMVHCEFNGSAAGLTKAEFIVLTGRVIIDAFHFSKTNPNDDYAILTDPFEDERTEDDTDNADQTITFPHDVYHDHQRSNGPRLPRIDASLEEKPSKAIQEANRRFFEANARFLALMVPNVPGYSLKHNRWFSLDVSKLKSVSWHPNPLERLVFDKAKKDIVSTFAQHHAGQMKSSSDSIASKGTGLVILLSGPPGTGKTLTAEAIAEDAKLPLYRILAGDLGSLPSAIERRLTEILDLALQWRCVVLLDEADTFINKRDSQDRLANEIVSIFLRQLEYFRGIIFLTSNLPQNIDDAFRSRCRLHIPYPALESSSRREVWKINFRSQGLIPENYDPSFMDAGAAVAGKLRLSSSEWDDLVDWRLSGREIHNVVENVILWCTSTDRDVSRAELEQTIQLTVPYAKKASGLSEVSLRADEDEPDSQVRRKRPRPA